MSVREKLNDPNVPANLNLRSMMIVPVGRVLAVVPILTIESEVTDRTGQRGFDGQTVSEDSVGHAGFDGQAE
jgi:hypothetical protein